MTRDATFYEANFLDSNYKRDSDVPSFPLVPELQEDSITDNNDTNPMTTNS